MQETNLLNSNKAKTILFDFDEVMAPLFFEVRPYLSREYKTEEFDWGFTKFDEKDREIIFALFENKEFMDGIPLFKETLTTINTLHDEQYDICVCTDVSLNLAESRVQKIVSHFEFLNRSFLIGPRKDLILGFAIFDDKLENILTSPCTHRILVDKPWNQVPDENMDAYIRAFGEVDFLPVIRMLESGYSTRKINEILRKK